MSVTRAWIVVAAAIGCDRIAGIPDPVPIDAAPDATPQEIACNYVDDDVDGLSDEGFTYVERVGQRRIVDTAANAALWWTSRSATRIAVTWVTGIGNGADIVRMQVFDHALAPVAPKVETTFEQPWSVAEGFWIGGTYVFAAVQPSYVCATPTTCKVYLLAIDEDGTQTLAPTLVETTATHEIVGAYATADEYVLALEAPDYAGAVRLRSFKPDGTAGSIATDLVTSAPGEIIHQVRAIRSDSSVYWIHNSNLTGITLRVTDLAGVMTRGPITLASGSGLGLTSRAAANAVILDNQIVLAYQDDRTMDEGAPIRAWTLDGEPIGDPVRLAGMTRFSSMDRAGDQIYVLGYHGAGDEQSLRLWRLSTDLRINQSDSPIDTAGRPYVSGVVAADDVAVVATSSVMEASQPITISALACP